MWRRAIDFLPAVRDLLPRPGIRVAILGCGTSFFIAQAAALRREAEGLGETDALVASEMPAHREYDLVVAISRSGTTTEVVQALTALEPGQPTLAISAVPDSPVVAAADESILLDFADEISIVQTRFATTALALLRAHFGDALAAATDAAQASVQSALPIDPDRFQHYVFLGRGWAAALASEAALKFREAAGAWTESYPAMEYRHGPISVAGPGSLVWFLGGADPALVDDVRATGATVVHRCTDAMAELVTIQQSAVSLAEAHGLDPDQPRHLTRSVMLS
jgi:glucosamine--fructose-6-phosphate aminotransferase (isomerizing)